MGTWGFKIDQDDFVCDVMVDFENRLKSLPNLEAVSQAILEEYAAFQDDPDEGPLFWIALAHIQWKYGWLQPPVLDRVRGDILSGAGLDRWAEAGENDLASRKKELDAFLKKISQPNPKPARLPKIVIRKPIYQAGDCLAIKLINGQYGAAIVTVSDHTNPEHGQNLIAVLDYLSDIKPTRKDFEKRNWLILSHHSWNNKMDAAWYTSFQYRKYKDRFEVICQIPILEADPQESREWAGWGYLGNTVIDQHQWDAGIRD